MISNSGDGLAASAAGTAPPPSVGADGSAWGRSSSSDGLEDSDDEEEEEEDAKIRSHIEEVTELTEETDDEEEEDEEEAEEELEDVEGLLLARFLDRLAGGFAAFTSCTPLVVKRSTLPSLSL
jgi:hypothetical protein